VGNPGFDGLVKSHKFIHRWRCKKFQIQGAVDGTFYGAIRILSAIRGHEGYFCQIGGAPGLWMISVSAFQGVGSDCSSSLSSQA